MAGDTLRLLEQGGGEQTARDVVAAMRLDERVPERRPRVVAAMVASLDGRATIEGRSGGLGNAADRSLFRELRTAADALLVGPRTLKIERYAKLLDQHQREHRLAAGRPVTPLLATVARRHEPPSEIPLFAEPDARIQVYTESDAPVQSRGAQVAVERMRPGELTLARALEHMRAELGVHVVSCEGGPTLLRALLDEGCVDDLVLTIAPLLVSGPGPSILSGAAFEPPLAGRLSAAYRAGDHLFLHYEL